MLTGTEIRRAVCLDCPERKGKSDDPEWPNLFCEKTFACGVYITRVVETFPIVEEENFLNITGIDLKIPKDLVDPYINHIIDRLRKRTVVPMEWHKDRLLARVMELEDVRAGLHYKIKKYIGAESWDIGTTTTALEALLEHYVNEKVRKYA